MHETEHVNLLVVAVDIQPVFLAASCMVVQGAPHRQSRRHILCMGKAVVNSTLHFMLHRPYCHALHIVDDCGQFRVVLVSREGVVEKNALLFLVVFTLG